MTYWQKYIATRLTLDHGFVKFQIVVEVSARPGDLPDRTLIVSKPFSLSRVSQAIPTWTKGRELEELILLTFKDELGNDEERIIVSLLIELAKFVETTLRHEQFFGLPVAEAA